MIKQVKMFFWVVEARSEWWRSGGWCANMGKVTLSSCGIGGRNERTFLALGSNLGGGDDHVGGVSAGGLTVK
jgi:hypothetical protein